MKRPVLLILTLAVGTALIGCASRSYVRRQIRPIDDKVGALEQQTAQNTNEIKQVDARAQAGIQDAKAEAAAADQKAELASQQANQALSQSNAVAKRVDTLQPLGANADNYSIATEAAVTFKVNQDSLTATAKAQLDQLVSRASNIKDYIFVVKGYTDSRGREHYNYGLSTRRADAVTEYLVAQHNVPAYKIYAVGLGENSPVASNETHPGRAKNRRAEVSLMTNTAASATTASNQ